jgi:hypothetical protein
MGSALLRIVLDFIFTVVLDASLDSDSPRVVQCAQIGCIDFGMRDDRSDRRKLDHLLFKSAYFLPFCSNCD